MKPKIKILLKLLITFLKISPITFGGGYAMLSLIETEVVERNRWLNKEEMIDVLTVAQTVPGAVAINCAIFIGYRVAGLVGAIISLIGILFPTLFIIMLVSIVYYFFNHSQWIKSAFNGIGAAVVALIFYSGFNLGRSVILNLSALFIMTVSVIILLIFSINPILIIIAGFLIGFVIKLWPFKKVSMKKNESQKQENVYFKDSL